MRRALVSSLVAGALLTTAAGTTLAQDEDLRMGDDPTGYERVEVAEAGIAVSFPPDWDVDVAMDYVAYADADPAAGYWIVLSAQDHDGGGCDLTLYPDVEVSLPDLAQTIVDNLPTEVAESAITEVTAVQLPVGEAHRVDVGDPESGRTAAYLFDGGRFDLTCWSDAADEPVWADSTETWGQIARTLELLPGEPPSDTAELQRLEMPGAGVAVSLPSDWVAERVAESQEMALPSGTAGEAWATTILLAFSEHGPNCAMEMFEDNPLTLEEHVAWVERYNREVPGFEGSIDHVPVQLPAGAALRIDGDHQGDGVWTTIYLFEEDDTRYLLYCADAERDDDDYLGLAETIELMDPAPDDLPVDAVSWSEVGDFPLTVAVSDDTEGAWKMNAWCDRALWIENPDGTFEERLRCQLNDDPVDPPEAQGQPPAETRITSGGACEWLSDFWLNYDGGQYYAEAWSMSVEPDGTVLAVATFGAEALDCS